MLRSNLNLNLRTIAGYNNKILVSNIDMKISSHININKAVVYHQKFIQSQSPLTQSESHVARKIHSVKILNKPIKDAEAKGN